MISIKLPETIHGMLTYTLWKTWEEDNQRLKLALLKWKAKQKSLISFFNSSAGINSLILPDDNNKALQQRILLAAKDQTFVMMVITTLASLQNDISYFLWTNVETILMIKNSNCFITVMLLAVGMYDDG